MRIGLDVRHAGLPGIGRVALDLWAALLAEGADVVALGPAGSPGGWLGAGGRRPPGAAITVQARPFLPLEQVTVPRALRRAGVDVHHATHFNVPYRARLPIVMTAYDLFPYLETANARSRAAGLYYRAVLPRAVRRADALVAISRFAAEQFADLLDVPADKLHVADLGVDLERFQAPAPDRIAAARARLGLAATYVLYVGTAKRHKNLPVLLRAWDRAGARLPPLVLAGPTRAEVSATRRDPLPPEVLPLGRVLDDDLPALYAGATALVLPSRYEAVGLTALEAMACGTPVIASDGGGLPDTVGDAGLVLPPDDDEAWADAIERVATDGELTDRLVAVGRTQVARRDWASAARTHLDVYRALARG